MADHDLCDLLDGVTDENAKHITLNSPIEVLEWREQMKTRLFPSFLKEAVSYTGGGQENENLIASAFQDSLLNLPLGDDESILVNSRTSVGVNI